LVNKVVAVNNRYFLFGLGAQGTAPNRTRGVAFSSNTGTTWSDFNQSPGESFGGDCTSSGGTDYFCVVARAPGGLSTRDSLTNPTVNDAFPAVADVPSAFAMYDVDCWGAKNCTAVGVAEPGTANEKGVIAQTTNGLDWFWTYYGVRELRRVSCTTTACFIGDENGAVIRGE
jgi:hypothetical protein